MNTTEDPRDATDATDPADAHDGEAAENGPALNDPALQDHAEDAGTTSVYVRRRRIPTLVFWVAVLIGAPMVIALVISPFLALQNASGVATFVLTVGVFVGIPLAAVAAAIDAVRNARGGPRRR